MCRLFRYAVGLTLLLSSLVSNAHGQAGDQRRPLEWRTLVIADFGTRIDYPTSIFTQAGKSKVGTGQQFERVDGGATLSVYSRPNVSGETPRTYLRNNLSDCVGCQAYCHGFLSLIMALRMTRSLRATAMRATIFGFPAARRRR
jgi:hypothetical protein